MRLSEFPKYRKIEKMAVGATLKIATTGGCNFRENGGASSNVPKLDKNAVSTWLP
jgi:hypothetical protein